MSANTTSRFSWRGFQEARLPQVPSWVETLGRAGHIAKGVVYFIVGFLAFRVTIGAGGEVGGARNAIREIGEQPYGKLMLGLVAIGLLGYTAWRWVQAIQDTEGAGTEAKGLVKRTGYAISGVAYAVLGSYAGSLSLGWVGGPSSGQSSKASFLLDSMPGRIVLGAAGAITIGVGIYFAVKGYHAKFMTKYQLAEMGDAFRTTALHAGRIGLITRGIAFVIIGYFLAQSAWQGTGNGEIAGMGDALSAIASQTYGRILLGVVGFGLMAYAVHMFLLGCYRRFNVAN
ncbi:putative integraal membrane protein [Rhodopirellula islandica]|uniref:Integraal membrane protein n=1 Tax=Rhodopirellula islandica TaxID=595434 RepID=A0A0J1B463_RHOIS|nr:DUF1206 domain-containing protein [Rhodopirellula islandica]KLU01547.1 putative integraal membrane protein [Rhodopirellula islandica]